MMAPRIAIFFVFALAVPCQALLEFDFAESRIHWNDLGHKGPAPPDCFCPRILSYDWPNGASLSFKNTTDYVLFDGGLNGLNGSFGSLNVNDGTCVTLTVTAKKPANTQRELSDETSFYFTVLDIDGGATNQKSVRISGFREYFVADDTELSISTLTDGSMKFKATARQTSFDLPLAASSLSQSQQKKAVTFLFKEKAQFEMTLCMEGGFAQSGRSFLFAGSSSLVQRYQGKCLETRQVVPPQVSFDFAGSAVTGNNLAGKGPMFDEKGWTMQFGNVGKVGTQSVDLVISVPGNVYEPSTVGDNGMNGNGFGIINVRNNYTVDLLFELVDSTTRANIAPSLFYMGFFDFDLLPSGEAREVLTLWDVADYVRYPWSKVDVEDVAGGVKFTSTTVEGGGDEATDVHNMNNEQKKKRVIAMFKDRSSFSARMTVEAPPNKDYRAGRDFMFAAVSPMLHSDPDLSPCEERNTKRAMMQFGTETSARKKKERFLETRPATR